jgi:hypothetical protein
MVYRGYLLILMEEFGIDNITIRESVHMMCYNRVLIQDGIVIQV